MANTISNISLANTFGDWVSTTVQVVNELNYIGNSDWRKTTGTIFLESNGTSLDVANSSFFRGAVTIVGASSSLTVHKNQAIHGTLSLTNTDIGANPNKLVLSANGVANVNYVNIVGAGLSANVTNNMSVGGTLTSNIIEVDVLNNDYVNASFAFANTVNSYSYSANSWLQANDKLTLELTQSFIDANVDIVKLYTDTNIDANVATVKLYTDTNIDANVDIVKLYTDTNIDANVATVKLYTDTNIVANSISANAYTDSRVSILNNNIVANNLLSTNYANNTFLKLTGGALSGDINSPTTNAVFFNLSAQGNFTITGSTIYNSDIFTLNSAQISNTNAFFANHRPNGANAHIRWNESNKWWDLRDVQNPSFYSRILTANDYVSINTSISTANTNLKNYVDKSNTDNILYTNSQISANAVSANAVITKANTDLKNYTDSTFVKLTSTSQTIGGDVTVTGNLAVNGTTTTIDTQTLVVEDSLIKLAKDNTASDSLDIGFYGVYQTGGLTRYTGLFRKAADKYYLAQAITTDPTANTISNFGTGYRATLDANFTGGTVSGLVSPISVTDGGTGVSTSTGTGALTLNTSPVFSGTPTAPTAANGTYSTVLATTAFVLNANNIMKSYVDNINTSLTSQINGKISGSTVVDDTTSSDTLYLVFTANTSGNLVSSRVSTTKLSYQPSTGTVSATNFNSTSDVRYKENIVKIENATDTVNLLNGVSFDWKETGTKSYGVIAQEIEKVLPELVGVSGEGKSVNYLGIIAFLINSIKELDERVKKLEKE
jgi:hypothetical protein